MLKIEISVEPYYLALDEIEWEVSQSTLVHSKEEFIKKMSNLYDYIEKNRKENK